MRHFIVLALVACLPSGALAAGWYKAENYSGSAEKKISPGSRLMCEPDASGCEPIEVNDCSYVSIGFDGDKSSPAPGTATVMPQRCEATVAAADDANCIDVLVAGLVDGGTTSFDMPSPGVIRGKRTVAQTGAEKPRLTINCTR